MLNFDHLVNGRQTGSNSFWKKNISPSTIRLHRGSSGIGTITFPKTRAKQPVQPLIFQPASYPRLGFPKRLGFGSVQKKAAPSHTRESPGRNSKSEPCRVLMAAHTDDTQGTPSPLSERLQKCLTYWRYSMRNLRKISMCACHQIGIAAKNASTLG